MKYFITIIALLLIACVMQVSQQDVDACTSATGWSKERCVAYIF